MAVKEILKLGNPELYKVSEKVDVDETQIINEAYQDLKDTMFNFREKYNCGRAIAAPQIGIQKRIIYMNLDGEEILFINPEIINKSQETYVLWDDCMSFPELLVKVRRHKNIEVKYFDRNFSEQFIEFEDDLSELFQHEYDHLDGILATMRAIDEKAIIYKTEKSKIG